MAAAGTKSIIKWRIEGGMSWDGGAQERTAALRFLREVAGKDTNAKVESSRRSGVRIFANDKLVVEVAQRRMYRKYNWPAKKELQTAVTDYLQKS